MSIYIAGEDLRDGDLVMNYPVDSNYVLKYDKNFKFKKGEYLNFAGVVVKNEEHIPSNPFREKDSRVTVHSFGKIWVDIPKDVEFKNDDLVYVNEKNQVMIAPKGIDERCCIGHIVGDKKWDREINSTDNIMILKIDTRKYKGCTTDFAEMISGFKESTGTWNDKQNQYFFTDGETDIECLIRLFNLSNKRIDFVCSIVFPEAENWCDKRFESAKIDFGIYDGVGHPATMFYDDVYKKHFVNFGIFDYKDLEHAKKVCREAAKLLIDIRDNRWKYY